MQRLLRTAIAGTIGIGLTSSLSPVVSALSLIEPRRADPLVRFWARSVLRAAGVRTTVEGLDLLPAGPFVLAANHQSNFDVVVLLASIERHLRFVAKRELRKVPFLGFGIEHTGNVFVDRDGGKGDKETLSQAALRIREGVSIAFFPEGTRSEDGRLKPFKKGAAVMALAAQVPLVPVAVAGTRFILEKGSFMIRSHPAALVIGAPIDTAGKSVEQRDQLTAEARDAVQLLLNRANALLGV